jgi:hypothetical protein
MRTVAVAALVVLTAGCGPEVVVGGESVDAPYDGPLHVAVSEPDHPDVLVRSGAAGQALECAGAPYLGDTGRNAGVGGGHDSAVDAVEEFVRDASWTVPPAGYRVEREAGDRVLFSFDVDGRTKVAVIVADGLTDTLDRTGWGVETFALCNPAEFPAPVTDELGINVWSNDQGDRVPTTTISSGRGPEHCDWDSATFLHLDDRTFAKDPDDVLPPEWFQLTYDDDVSLPPDARDTGYRLERQRLFLAVDGSAAFIVTEQGAERWPATAETPACA